MNDDKFPVYLDAEEADMVREILEARLDSIDRRTESLRKSAKELGVFSFDKTYATYSKLIRKAERERDVLTDAWSAIVRARGGIGMTKATELRDIADFANKRGEKYENEQASFLYGSWLDKMKEAAKSGEYSMELRAFPKERLDYAIIERARNLLSSNGFDIGEGEVSAHFYTNPVTNKIDEESIVSFSVNWAV